MKVIVTGAGGFVGRNLISCFLEHGDSVTAVDLIGNDSLEKLQHDNLRKVFLEKKDGAERLREALDEKKFDAMVHLAWVGAGGPLRADYTVQLNNVKMTLDYFMAADQLGCQRFVAVGTIGEYMADLALKNDISSENFIYANCKSMTHNLLNIVERQTKCKAIWATLGNLYGVGDSTNNLVNYTIKALLTNQRPKFGPAEQPFDFVNIKDCVNALWLITKTDTVSKSFYVGSGHPRLLKEFLWEIDKCVGNGVGIGIGEYSDDGSRYLWPWYDISLLEKETGYCPAYSFENGIKEILRQQK